MGIVARFLRGCTARDKTCFIVLFPTPSSYRYFAATGRSATQPLLDEFDRNGFPYLNLTPLLADRLGMDEICTILTRPERCIGHFNEDGNRLVAELVRTHLPIDAALDRVATRSRPSRALEALRSEPEERKQSAARAHFP